MNILPENSQLNDLMRLSKSNSGANGNELRTAHKKMGYEISKYIRKVRNVIPDKTTVVALFRAGLFFGQGIADELDCAFLCLDEKNDKRWNNGRGEINQYIKENYQYIENRFIILADAVINTGKTLLDIYETLKTISKKIVVATCVIQSNAIPLFDGIDLFAVRVSENKFVGAKINIQKGNIGPDTGDRLFRTL
jgi:orotate phosphoribosyltransferase-like protein